MADVPSVEFAVKVVFHQRIYSYELTLFLFEQQKVELFVYQQRKVLLKQLFNCKLYNAKNVVTVVEWLGSYS